MHTNTGALAADHKERALDFCLRSGKPWALLLPNYVATKVRGRVCTGMGRVGPGIMQRVRMFG